MHAFLICGQDQNRVGEQIEKLLRSSSGKIAPGNKIDLRPSAKKESQVPTLTIEDVRFISNWLSQQSSKSRAVIVHQAQSLTIPAQQAFLKTLEEPEGSKEYGVWSKEQGVRNNDGDNSVTIILTADSEISLLPTIRSRCKIIRLLHETSTTHVDSLRYSARILQRLIEIGKKSPSERLIILYELFSEFSGKKISPNQQGSIPRPNALKFMEHIIDSLHQTLPQYSTPDLQRSTDNAQRSLTTYFSVACLSHRRLKNNLNVQLALQQFILDIPAI